MPTEQHGTLSQELADLRDEAEIHRAHAARRLEQANAMPLGPERDAVLAEAATSLNAEQHCRDEISRLTQN